MGTAFDPTTFIPGETPYSSSEMNKLGQGIAAAMPVGAIISSFVLQPGFVELAGGLLSRTTYDALWQWASDNDLVGVGKPFGVGDGATTFLAPDWRDRSLVGASTTRPVGATGGSTTHSHGNPTSGSAGNHSHSQSGTGSAGSHAHTNPDTGSNGSHAHTNPDTGSAGSHSHTTGTSNNNLLADSGNPIASVPKEAHSHSVSTASSHAHSQGNTGTEGSHAHSQGNTGTGGSHAHSNPDTSSVASHQHTVGNTGTSDHLPPWAATIWQIRF